MTIEKGFEKTVRTMRAMITDQPRHYPSKIHNYYGWLPTSLFNKRISRRGNGISMPFSVNFL